MHVEISASREREFKTGGTPFALAALRVSLANYRDRGLGDRYCFDVVKIVLLAEIDACQCCDSIVTFEEKRAIRASSENAFFLFVK